MTLKPTQTARGFTMYEWQDRYSTKCSLQDSSLATEACVWLGVDKAEVKTFRPGEGWKDMDLPEEASIFSRMHLNVEQVKELLPLLNHFVETGFLPAKDD
jgi:hypothetical protein